MSLIKVYSDVTYTAGLTAALTVKQARQEASQANYHHLRQDVFGSRNEPGMEEETNFKSLFILNLHSATSHHLGVAACPITLEQFRAIEKPGPGMIWERSHQWGYEQDFWPTRKGKVKFHTPTNTKVRKEPIPQTPSGKKFEHRPHGIKPIIQHILKQPIKRRVTLIFYFGFHEC